MKRQLPVVAGMRSAVRSDGTRATVHPADVRGRFNRARNAVFVALIVVYLALPWVTVGGRPAVLLDIGAGRFFLLGHAFNAQDFWMSFFLLSGIGFTLIAVTTVLGRVWCGWACPQTVWLEGVFRPIQRLIEGSAEKRRRREEGGWSFDRAWRRAALWAVYAAIASALAHVFLGYFVPIRTFWAMIAAGPGQHPEAFAWVTAMTAVLFFDFAWFREQTCLAICPYGRLQSSMTDPDTLVVGYDAVRGEPRGKAKSEGVGDCVDCGRCVAVCPTGIDIRNGLQLDCVGCTACIDACDEVMDKLHRPRGLVRYDSQNGLAHLPKKFLRPRLALYAVLGLAGLAALALATRSRTPFEANVLRLAGAPYTIEGDSVRNAFEVHLVNKRESRVSYTLAPTSDDPAFTYVLPLPTVTLDALSDARLPVFVTAPRERVRRDSAVRLRVSGGGEVRVVTAPFLGPDR